MICHHCNADNGRSELVCNSCGSKLHAVRHSCTFINTTTDLYCGGCGQSLLRVGSLVKRRPVDDFLEGIQHFSEQELLQLLDLQQHAIMAGKKASISQSDVDKLFQ